MANVSYTFTSTTDTYRIKVVVNSNHRVCCIDKCDIYVKASESTSGLGSLFKSDVNDGEYVIFQASQKGFYSIVSQDDTSKIGTLELN